MAEWTGIIVAILIALFGYKVTELWKKPRPELILYNINGEDAFLNNNEVIYYHLKIQNKKGILKNASVNLIGLLVRDFPDKEFREISFNVPRPFNWDPSELEKSKIDIINYKVFDFYLLKVLNGSAYPLLVTYPNNFSGSLTIPGQTILCFLELEAENYVQKKPYVISVSLGKEIESNYGRHYLKIEDHTNDWSKLITKEIYDKYKPNQTTFDTLKQIIKNDLNKI